MTADPSAPEQPPAALPPLPESQLPNEHALYRPRHDERQRTAKVAAAVFFLTPILLLALGVRAPEFENRRLASFPSPADGLGFFTGFDRWATDQLPLRDSAVAAADAISRGVFGEPYPFGQKHQGGPVQNSPQPQNESLEGVEIPRASGFPVVLEGSDNWLYLGYDVQAACQRGMDSDQLFSRLNRLRAGVEASGRKFVLVVPPNKATVVPEHLPASYLGAKCYESTRDEFWRRLAPETKALDLRAGLAEAGRVAGQPVYAKNDTHWTHEGGLVMVRALAEEIQPGATKDWRLTKSEVVDLESDLPELLGRRQHRPAQLYDLAPDGEKVTSRIVNDRFGEPKHYTQPAGPGTVRAKVGLVGDSFAFTMVSYLVGGFSDLSMVHTDLLGTDPARVGRMLADQDVVVLEGVERSFVGGTSRALSDAAIDAIVGELAKRPR